MSSLPTLGPRGEGWVVIQVILFVAIALAGWLIPGSVEPSIAAWLGLAGVGAVVVGASIAYLATRLLHPAGALTVYPRPRSTATLVDAGPYAGVRHPIYAGIVLAGLGWALVRASGTALLLDLVLLVFFDLKRRREETWLVEHLPGYVAYMRRTAALIPWLY